MDIATTLRHAIPFRRAPAEAVEAIARHAVTRTLQHDELLWRAGDPPSHFCVIHSGLLKIVRPLSNGRDAILGVFGPHEGIGDVAVLQGIPFPASAAVCTASALVVRIPRQVVLAELERSPGLSLSLTQSMSEHVQTLHAKVDILSAGSVESRLASLLLDLARRFGDEFEDGTVGIPITLSRQDLASLVSTSFETAIRIMSRWQKQGILGTNSDGFVLHNAEHLQQVARNVSGARGGGRAHRPSGG